MIDGTGACVPGCPSEPPRGAGSVLHDEECERMNMMVLELEDTTGRPVLAELLIRLDTVELRCQDVVVGITLREHLREWLARPWGQYVYDDMAWLRTEDGVSLAIADLVPWWPLTPMVMAGLKEWV